eukprot:sb/3476628/
MYVKTFSGKPIYKLSDTVLEKLCSISQPGLPSQVYELVYATLLEFTQFEEYLSLAGNDMSGLAVLYNNIRNIIIADVPHTDVRIPMLELLERKAYGEKLPESVKAFYAPYSPIMA